MTCKEIRSNQLDELKDGTAEARYILQVIRHDGREITRERYESRKELEAAAVKMRKTWEPYAHILLYAEFQI